MVDCTEPINVSLLFLPPSRSCSLARSGRGRPLCGVEALWRATRPNGGVTAIWPTITGQKPASRWPETGFCLVSGRDTRNNQCKVHGGEWGIFKQHRNQTQDTERSRSGRRCHKREGAATRDCSPYRPLHEPSRGPTHGDDHDHGTHLRSAWTRDCQAATTSFRYLWGGTRRTTYRF